MVRQNFVGDKPVDSFPPETIQKIPDDELTKREVKRLSEGANKEPGANKRAGVATRDPARTSIHAMPSICTDSCTVEFEAKHRGGQGDHLPTEGTLAQFESSLMTCIRCRTCHLGGRLEK